MAQIHVLLVEDNEDNLDLMKFLLERASYLVSTARNGREGFDRACELKPDVILMDLSLPEVDGWTAAKMMRADSRLAQTPLIAVTAHTLPGDRRKAFDSGFDSYISKPINVRMFDIMVAKALEEKSKTNRREASS